LADAASSTPPGCDTQYHFFSTTGNSLHTHRRALHVEVEAFHLVPGSIGKLSSLARYHEVCSVTCFTIKGYLRPLLTSANFRALSFRARDNSTAFRRSTTCAHNDLNSCLGQHTFATPRGEVFAMAPSRDVTRRQPNAKDDHPDQTDDASRRTAKYAPRESFFNRRVRLTSDSTLSVPLALVLLFPCLVIIVILTLFARSPDSNELMNMPTGTSLSVRYVTVS
jgi:hypothetical protein